MKRLIAIAVVTAGLGTSFVTLSQESPTTSSPASNSPKAGTLPPRSDGASSGESSSKDTKIPLESPAVDRSGTAGGGGSAGDVREMRPWDPHKADKAVEVGDFYFKRGNYAAAISRYREALYWKQDDAVALFRLGQSLEAVGQYAEARTQYKRYLQVLPNGPFAGDAQKALNRLKDKPDVPKKMERPVL